MSAWYPVITTGALDDCERFYVTAFDAQVMFRNPWYLHLGFMQHELGFIQHNPDGQLPVFPHITQTRGLSLVVEVDDVTAWYDELQRRRVPPLGPIRPYNQGEPSLTLVDPAGTVLNLVERRSVQQLDPAATFDGFF
ncbi:MAG TPA: hypothetical protein VGE51_11530 [Fontimonas sp.]